MPKPVIMPILPNPTPFDEMVMGHVEAGRITLHEAVLLDRLNAEREVAEIRETLGSGSNAGALTVGIPTVGQQPRQIRPVFPAAGVPAVAAQPRQEEIIVSERSSWWQRDLTPVLEGTWRPPAPTVGRRSDGKGIFYAGKSHTVVSESEHGKTWMALAAVLDELAAGHHVVYIDFEDSEGGLAGRLLTLAAKPETIATAFHYVRPESPLSGGRGDLDELLAAHTPTLAVVDGITEAMAMHGLDPNKNNEIAMFNALLIKPLTDSGAAVVSLDHVVKNGDNRGRYALGGVHKLNAVTGAAYLLESRQPFGVGITGRSTVKIAKDRPGQLRPHGLPSAGSLTWYGDLVLASHDQDFAEVGIEPPQQQAENFKPTIYMQRISQALQQHGKPMSGHLIETAVIGKAATIRTALSHLILDGYVTNKSPHTLIKPYDPEAQQP